MNPDNEVPPVTSSGGFHHDHIRLLIIYWSQKHGYKAHSEPLGFGKYRPDLELRRKKKKKGIRTLMFVEIQKDDKKQWRETKEKQYKGNHLAVIQPDLYDEELSGRQLYKVIKNRMDAEAEFHVPRKVSDTTWKRNESDSTMIDCPECSARIKRTQLKTHLKYKCKKRKK